MTTCDWILAAGLALAFFTGWRWGTINVVAKIGALILGYYAARTYASPLADYAVQALPGLTATGESSEKLISFLSLFINTDGIANRLIQLVLFLLIFIVVSWVIKRIAYALTGIFSRGLLGKINRFFGAILSFALGLLLILILTDIVFPALAGMGLGNDALVFMESSQKVLPLIRDLQYLV